MSFSATGLTVGRVGGKKTIRPSATAIARHKVATTRRGVRESILCKVTSANAAFAAIAVPKHNRDADHRSLACSWRAPKSVLRAEVTFEVSLRNHRTSR